MRFTRSELEKFRDTTVPDLIGSVGSDFARRGNRFYPALYAAGLVPPIIRDPDRPGSA